MASNNYWQVLISASPEDLHQALFIHQWSDRASAKLLKNVDLSDDMTPNPMNNKQFRMVISESKAGGKYAAHFQPLVSKKDVIRMMHAALMSPSAFEFLIGLGIPDIFKLVRGAPPAEKVPDSTFKHYFKCIKKNHGVSADHNDETQASGIPCDSHPQVLGAHTTLDTVVEAAETGDLVMASSGMLDSPFAEPKADRHTDRATHSPEQPQGPSWSLEHFVTNKDRRCLKRLRVDQQPEAPQHQKPASHQPKSSGSAPDLNGQHLQGQMPNSAPPGLPLEALLEAGYVVGRRPDVSKLSIALNPDILAGFTESTARIQEQGLTHTGHIFMFVPSHSPSKLPSRFRICVSKRSAESFAGAKRLQVLSAYIKTYPDGEGDAIEVFPHSNEVDMVVEAALGINEAWFLVHNYF
jgi:hypothetical protein